MPHQHSLSSGNPSASKPVDGDLHAVHKSRTQHDFDSIDVPPAKEKLLERLLASPVRGSWASPDPLGKLNMSPLATPSCWGTPDLHQGSKQGMFAEAPSGMTEESLRGIFAGNVPPRSTWLEMQNLQSWTNAEFLSLANTISLPPPPDPRPCPAASAPPVDVQVADPPTLRLRGLPFDTTVQDVLSFFSHYGVSDKVSDASNAVQILSKNNGKPSGHAIVQLRNAEDADVVEKTLHMKIMGKRYIEVLAHAPDKTGSGSQAPALKFQQASAGQPQQNVEQSAPTLYSDWLLQHLAMSMAHCSTEHEFASSLNTGFKTLPREECGRQMFGLRV